MLRAIFAVFIGTTMFAADTDFNGQWNIAVQTPRGRVWWLEVRGVGAGKLTGSFVGAPGGQVDPITDLRVENGELTFSFERDSSGPGSPKTVQRFRAKLAGGQLQGTRVERAGAQAESTLAWTGKRAPEIREKDGPGWVPGTALPLFDGKDLNGWHKLVENRPGWVVENGLLKNEKGASDLVSNARFWNFVLRAEYRYAKGSNSGIGVRGRYEVQIYDDYGTQPDAHNQGALYSRVAPAVTASNPPGEWQVMEIRIVGRDLSATLNGKQILNKATALPTAITIDPDEDQPGPIVLQGDHGPIEFRSITVTPLTAKR